MGQLRTKELIPGSWTCEEEDRQLSAMPKHKYSSEFDRAERDIHKEAIHTLQSFCRTNGALASLEAFRMQLGCPQSMNSSRRPSIAPPSDVTPPYCQGQWETTMQYPPTDLSEPKSGKLSNSLPSTIFRKVPNASFRDCGVR